LNLIRDGRDDLTAYPAHEVQLAHARVYIRTALKVQDRATFWRLRQGFQGYAPEPPWNVRGHAMPRRLDVLKVAPHRFSWKRAGMVGHPRGPWQVFPQRPDTSDDGGTSG
jgi:hypothetical protein